MTDTRSIQIERTAMPTGGEAITLCLNRPEARNAISTQMLAELETAIETCADGSVRCLIITGQGPAFCAGADLKERAGMTPEVVRGFLERTGLLFRKIERLPLPVIAALNGSALGGGLELALCCDLRIASEEAMLGLTETSLGIIPGAGGTQRLSRAIGLERAREMIFCASRISGREAAACGLILEAVPAHAVRERALGLAHAIARNAPIAIREAKRAINDGYDLNLEDGLRLEREAYEITIPTRDRTEALNAFREKRSPEFRGE